MQTNESIAKDIPTLPPPTHWNVEAAKAAGIYTYFKEISAELPYGKVISKGQEMIMLGGYSYLGLNKNKEITQAAIDAIEKYGTGMSGSRFLAGTTDIHKKLEKKIAEIHQKEDAVCYTSGYLANVSTIACILRKGDFLFADKLNHASIIDGCLYSRANFKRYRHNDIEQLEQLLQDCPDTVRKLVIVDGVFSMSGAPCNLPEIIDLCKKYRACLMVDECHSFYVTGKTGRGICEHFGIHPDSIDIVMCTLSKAIPAGGGYIASNRQTIEYLRHESRGFIYSISLSANLVAAALKGLEIFEKNAPDLVKALHENTKIFKDALLANNVKFGDTITSIVPILIGDGMKATIVARECQNRGIFIHAVLPPVVPQGSSILRASITAAHRKKDLIESADIIKSVIEELE